MGLAVIIAIMICPCPCRSVSGLMLLGCIMENESSTLDFILISPVNGLVPISAGWDYDKQCERYVDISPDDIGIICLWLKDCEKRIYHAETCSIIKDQKAKK